jgi:acyl-CoA thioester hydrolase
MLKDTPHARVLPCYSSPALRFTESRVRVRYKETDQMGIAHHANYIVWFEIGRTDVCREAGFPYTEIEAKGFILVVTEITCRYRVPFRYDDEVVIRTSLGETASRAMKFTYELYDAEGVLHAIGSSSHMWVDMDSRKPVRAPDDVMRAFERWRDSSASGE